MRIRVRFELLDDNFEVIAREDYLRSLVALRCSEGKELEREALHHAQMFWRWVLLMGHAE